MMTNIKVLLHEAHKIKSQIPNSPSSVPSASLEKVKWKLFEDNLAYVRPCPLLVCKPCFVWAEEEEGGGGGEEKKKKKMMKKKKNKKKEEEEEKKKKEEEEKKKKKEEEKKKKKKMKKKKEEEEEEKKKKKKKQKKKKTNEKKKKEEEKKKKNDHHHHRVSLEPYLRLRIFCLRTPAISQHLQLIFLYYQIFLTIKENL